MANKLFVVLFAFLAVQAWASAGILPAELQEFEDELPPELVEGFEEMPVDMYNEVFGDEPAKGDPNKCVPFIQEAYNRATEVKRIGTEGRGLRTKLVTNLKKCASLPTIADKKKCALDAVKGIITDAKKLIQAWKTVKPQIADSYNKFTKCLA